MTNDTTTSEAHPTVAALLAALEVAAAHLHTQPSALEVEHLERREWPDSWLGCPEPEEACADVITPGYAVVVAGAGQLLEYRADRRGRGRLCPTPDAGLPLVIFRHWLHLREQDTGDIEEYRPEGFVFPPAFQRDGFRIYADGVFIQEDLGPLDVPVPVLGRWELRGPNQVTVSFNSSTRDDFTFEIVSVDDSALRIRRSAQPGPAADAQGRQQEEASMARAVEEPNLFELTGEDVQITFSTTSFTGQPQLHYRDQQRDLTFTGADIESRESGLGRELTVVLDSVPDLHTITLTLLLPIINLGGVKAEPLAEPLVEPSREQAERTESSFATLGILTTHRTSIGGPQLVSGPLQLYRVVLLQGIARLVDF